MAQPTLADYQESTFSDAVLAETTGAITWLAGDFVVALGATEGNTSTLTTPTVTGLTFAAIASTPTNAANDCKMYAWTATAGAGGSGVVTSTSNNANAHGISVFVFRSSDGLGNTSIETGKGSTTTQSLIRGSANSHVVQIWGDWNAGNDVTVTWTPSGQTQREATFVTGAATFFVANWGDQGAAGTTSYGFSAGNAGAMAAITLEIKGTSSGVSPNLPTVNDAATLTESVTMKMDLKNMASNDAVTLVESVSMKMHLGLVAVNDAVTATDVPVMHMPISLRMEKLS